MSGDPFDCPPTLTDQEVLEFCKNGYLILKAVVPDEINRRTLGFLDEHPSNEPMEILNEDWFVDAVIKNPQAAGAVRSLLGPNFELPRLISNHRVKCPLTHSGGWHRDGGASDKLHLDFLQVFYYPQETPRELGPTEVVPSSHLLRIKRRFMAHYGNIRQGRSTAAPAGSIFITHYSIWHRATRSSASGIRNLLKYNYFRTASPQRDWLADPDFDFTQVSFANNNALPEKWSDSIRVAQLFLWLCGLEERFEFKGGQSWPITAGTGYQINQGMPSALAPRNEDI